MTDTDQAERIEKLEILFAEQEYTIETLNAIVTRQSDEITQLLIQAERFKRQLNEIKEQIPDSGVDDEKPPHY